MPRWPRVLWAVVGLGLLPVRGIVAPAAAADPPPVTVLWSKVRSFRIPVRYDPKDRPMLKELRLYVSDDMGATWQGPRKSSPDQLEFPFRAPRDGEYWFALQTVDKQGHYYPSGGRIVEPTLKIIVDSTAPMITLEPKGRRGSQAAVQWEVQDEHLDLRTLALEFQAEGARDWRQVPLTRKETGRIGYKQWDSGTAEALRVRLTIRDQAGNSRTVDQSLPDGLSPEPSGSAPEDRTAVVPITPISSRSPDRDPFEKLDGAPAAAAAPVAEAESHPTATPPPDQDFDEPPKSSAASEARPAESKSAEPDAAAAPSRPRTLFVRSPKFPLKYAVADAGPEGPALVELWVTRDGGRTWNRQPEDADHRSPYNVDLGNEGSFGLWLVVQSASYLGDLPPEPGATPQMWVEVDRTGPIVTLDPPIIGKGKNINKMAINWKASDPHPAETPISLYYRPDRPDAPWVKIIDNYPNKGRYVWNVPADVPPRFHLRVDAVDALGNRTTADSSESGAVVLDRARPRGKILGVETEAAIGANDTDRR